MSSKRYHEGISQALPKKIRQFSLLEKTFYLSVLVTAIVMAVSIIYLQSRNLELQHEVSILKGKLNEKETEYNNAKQEVNELSRRERILEVIEKFGITPQKDNIQKVE